VSSFRRVVRTPARFLQARGLVQTAKKQLASTDFVAGGAVSAAEAMVRKPCADVNRRSKTAAFPTKGMKEPCAGWNTETCILQKCRQYETLYWQQQEYLGLLEASQLS
jgi:hypothetical protein